VCTASGLCVAIPAYFFHRYFRGLVGDYVISMEQQVILLMDELTAQSEAPAAATPPPAVRATRARQAPAAVE